MYSKKYDFVSLANRITLKMMTEKEREDRRNPSVVFFLVLP